jgi:hypothetical protein
MKTSTSPVQLVRSLSGREDVSEAVGSLHDNVRTEAGLAVWRAINDQRDVVFSELKLATQTEKYHPDLDSVGHEIGAMIKAGAASGIGRGRTHAGCPRDLGDGKGHSARGERGKNTQQPLLEQIPDAVLNGLTGGQKAATTLVLGTTDRFIGIQGYAGVGKTTQMKAVKGALETLPLMCDRN